jgi:hypothetical protein
MSAEPDFKRLLTEFALAEFMRGLQSPDADSAPQPDHIGALATRARSYVLQQFGRSSKWTAINSAIWSTISERKDPGITLADVDEVAKNSSAGSNEVLSVLALLSRPASGLLKMEYLATDGAGNASVSKDEVTKKLRAWWREKTVTDDAWRSWAGKIIVKWTPVGLGGHANEA